MNRHVSALLIPKEFEHTVVHCGAELVVERTDGYANTGEACSVKTGKNAEATLRRFLHIYDEDERADKLRAVDLAPSLRAVHQAQLRELAWARTMLWSDARIRPFLTSASPALWPSVSALTPVVEVVMALKLYAESPADERGAEDLRRALHVLHREARHTGLHPLKEAPVAGNLTVYEQSTPHANSSSALSALPSTGHDRSDRVSSSGTSFSLPDNNCDGYNNNNLNYKRVRDVDSASKSVAAVRVHAAATALHRTDNLLMAPTALLLVPNSAVYIVSEALALPLTTRARESLTALLQKPLHVLQAGASTGAEHRTGTTGPVASLHSTALRPAPSCVSSPPATMATTTLAWSSFLALHRQCVSDGNRLGLIYSVQEMLRQFDILDESALAAMMQSADRQKSCVRLRGGVYATVLHRSALYLLRLPPQRMSSMSKLSAMLTREESASFAERTGRRYEHCVAEGAVLVLPASHPNMEESTCDRAFSSSHSVVDRDESDIALVRKYIQQRFLSPVLRDDKCESSYEFRHMENYGITATSSTSNDKWGGSVALPFIPLSSQRASRSLLHDRSASLHSRPANEGAQLLYVYASFNPFVVVHGTRVEDGFQGRTSVYEALRQQRDAVAEEQTELLLRRSHAQSTMSPDADAAYRSSDADRSDTRLDASEALPVRRDRTGIAADGTTPHALSASSSSVVTGEDRRQAFTSVVIEILSQGPQSRTEIMRHCALAPWRRAPELEAMLRQVLKSHAECKGRKFQLR